MKKILIVTIIVISSLIFLNSPTQAAVCNQTTISSVSTEYSGTPAIIGNGDIVRVNGDSFGNQGSYCIHDSNNSKTMEVHFVSPDGSVDKNVTPVSMSSGCKVSGYNPITDFNSSMVLFKIDLSIFTDSELQKFVDGGSVQVWNPTYDNGIFGSSVLCGSSNFKLTRFSDLSCTYTYSNWSSCSVNGIQTRTLLLTRPNDCAIGTPVLSQSCTFIQPICTSWIYSDWSDCSVEGSQTRTINSASPANCANGNPLLSQACVYVPKCTLNNWSCDNWSACSSDSTQNRACTKTANCKGGVSSPAISQTCAYTPPTCNYEYSSWSQCSTNGTQTRNAFPYPTGCSGGSPITSQLCAPSCTINSWQCDDWSACASGSKQTRVCRKTNNCDGGTQSPVATQYCFYTPPQPTCFEDTWSCGDWGSCSLQGIQTRSCKKTYDCSSAETPPPATSQYCEAPNRPVTPPMVGDSVDTSNQDTIIKATVKLICPLSNKQGWVSQGSGTVISSNGQILTNKHVINGTPGCLVGFIDNADSDPYFGDRQIADVIKVSADEDMALLKLRISDNTQLSFVDIMNSSINNKLLGKTLSIYGYPDIAGSHLTFSSGDFSGFEGNYLKTTAFIEHGNSGGGSYLKNGQFIGIPSKVAKGDLNSIGFILSANVVNSWLNNSKLSYNQSSNNNYSRVSSVYDGVNLDALKLFNASNVTVAIYSDKSKSTLLPNNPGTVQIPNRPLFKISNIGDSGTVGYYVYFGTNIKADPARKGQFTKKLEFVPPIIKQKGTYYFILRPKDKRGNTSDTVITEYRYKK